MLVLVLVFGMTVIGCDNGTTGGGGNGIPAVPQTNLEFVNQWIANGGTVDNPVTGQTVTISSSQLAVYVFRSRQQKIQK